MEHLLRVPMFFWGASLGSMGVAAIYTYLLRRVADELRRSLKNTSHPEFGDDPTSRIVNAATIGIYQCTIEGRLILVNDAAVELLGFESAAEMVASVVDIRSYLFRDSTKRDEFNRMMQNSGIVRRLDGRARRKDLGDIWLWNNARVVRGDTGIVGYEGTIENITDRKLIEDQLRESGREYFDFVEHAVVGIFQSTPKGRYLNANPAMVDMFGYDSRNDLLLSINDIAKQIYVDPKCREDLVRILSERGMVKDFECEVYRKDGRKIWVVSNVRAIYRNGAIVRYEGINVDVTQQRLLENSIRQSQKMEAMGQLAGGVAHDFNNALSVINGYTDLLQMQLPPASPSHSYAVAISKAAHRATVLTRQLSAFSQKQPIRPIVLDLNAATAELEKLLRRVIGENIQVVFKRNQNLGRIKMDPGQLEQVLIILAVNSRSAMSEGGILSIETANVEMEEALGMEFLYMDPGSYVRLSVGDTGGVINQNAQTQTYEALFATETQVKAAKGAYLLFIKS